MDQLDILRGGKSILSSHHTQEMNSRCIIDLKVKGKIMKEKNIWKYLYDLGVDKDIFVKELKETTIYKRKTSKLDYINTKNFCSSQDMTKTMKKSTQRWEKILTTHISYKGSKIYEVFLPINL